MLKKLYFMSFLFLLAFAACNKENDSLYEVDNLPVSFNSSIEKTASTGNPQTRVVGDRWEEGDKIGVFAIEGDAELKEATIIENYDNLSFSTTGNGVFSHDDQAIYYPTDGSAIDFISYYPYREGLNSYNYPIDIAHKQVDLLYSNNLKGATKENSSNNLEFERVLSKVIIFVEAADGVSLEGLSVELTDLKTKASFSLANGQLTIDETSLSSLFITPSKTAIENQMKASSIVLPTIEANTIKAIFKLADGTIYTKILPGIFVKGKEYIYKYTLTNKA